MSLSIMFKDGEESFGPYQLASSHGWTLVAEWAARVSCEPLRKLADDGEVKNTEALVRAIRKALKSQPPDSADVRQTLKEMLKHIGVGSAGETASVVD